MPPKPRVLHTHKSSLLPLPPSLPSPNVFLGLLQHNNPLPKTVSFHFEMRNSI